MNMFRVGRTNFARGLLMTAATAALCVPGVAIAQGDETDSVDSGNAIIVTATKRELTLQDTPVAVSVTTAETLERAQIRDLRDLQTVVPSLSVGQRQSTGNTNFFIRGFGNGANNAGIEPSVGVFVDGVYRSKTVSQITDLPDVQRIEVLRGPQSTLFGKNASAGVISITTQEPQFDFGGSVEATYGNYDQMIAKALVTGPLNDSAAVSLAAGVNKRDGFFRDLGTGDRTNERDRWFVRGQFLIDGGNGFKARLIADYDAIDENCCGTVNVQDGIAMPAVLALGGLAVRPEDRFAGFVYNNYNSTNDIKNYGASAQLDYDIGDFTLTSITAFRETKAVTAQDSDFTTADLIYPNFQDLDVGTFTQELRLAGQIGDRLNVLLGAFYIHEDIDQRNQLLYGEDFRPYANILVQQLSGCALALYASSCIIPGYAGPAPVALDATFGALEGDATRYINRFFPDQSGFTEAYTLKSSAISLFGQADFELVDGLVLTLGGNYTRDRKTFTTDNVSTDVFSSIELDAPQYAPFRRTMLFQGAVAQQVGAALGLGRSATAAEVGAFAGNAANAATFLAIQNGATSYADANQNNPLANPLAALTALQFMPPFLNLPNAVEDGKTRDSDFTYTARLAYDASRTLNLYASYATGFKASSINLSRDSRPSAADRNAIIDAGLNLNNLLFLGRYAKPEKSRVMELGAKYNDGTISANLAVFDQEIKGFQSNIFTGGGFVLLNAGKQSTFGVEFEGQVQPVDGLTLNLGATYLDPKYDSFEVSSVGDLSGQRPAGIPEWTVLIGAQYEAQVGNGTLIPRISYLWQDRVQLVEGMPGFLVRNPDGSIADNTAALAAAAQFTRQVNDLTASLGYELDNGLSFSIWGRNLTNHRDIGVIFDTPAQPRGISGYPNDPRTYGATVRFKW